MCSGQARDDTGRRCPIETRPHSAPPHQPNPFRLHACVPAPPSRAGVAALSEAVFQSGIAYRYRRGLDLNTSSVPQRAGKAWLATLLPNYVSVNTKSRGFELGYRPTLHLSNPWALALDAVPLHLTGDPASDVDRYRWAVGPALHWKRTSTVWSGVEAGVEVFGRWRGNPIGREPGCS